MHLASLTSLLELVCHHHVGSVDVVSDYLSAYDTADYGACVDADTHVQAVQRWLFFLDLFYLFEHVEGKTKDVLGLLYRVPVVTVSEA